MSPVVIYALGITVIAASASICVLLLMYRKERAETDLPTKTDD